MTSTSSTSPSSSTMICPEKLVTRELSNMSIEAYYHGGKSASVPFEWESEPGTPKFKSKDPSLPPLTPPPSYHYCNKASKNKPKKNPSSSKPNNILQHLFVKRPTRKQPPPFSSSASSSSSSYSSSFSSSFSSPAYLSVPSSPVICSRKREEEDDLYVDFHNTSRWRGGCSFMIRKLLPRDFL